MTPIEILAVKNHTALIGRTRAQIPFLYVPRDEDGIPSLLTDPEEIDASAYLNAVQTASDPRLVRGTIQRQDNGLLAFVVSADTPQEYVFTLLRDLQEGMAGQIPSLSNALVVTAA